MHVCRLFTDVDQLIGPGQRQPVEFPPPAGGDDPEQMTVPGKVHGLVFPCCDGIAVVSAVAVFEAAAGYDRLAAAVMTDPYRSGTRTLKRASVATRIDECPCVTLIVRAPVHRGEPLGMVAGHDASSPVALIAAELRVAIIPWMAARTARAHLPGAAAARFRNCCPLTEPASQTPPARRSG